MHAMTTQATTTKATCHLWLAHPPACRDGADSLRDFFYGVSHNRVQGAANMLLEAYHWVQAMFPYW